MVSTAWLLTLGTGTWMAVCTPIMASAAPAAFLGMGGELGSIAPDYRADLVLLDANLAARETWIGGRSGRGRTGR